MKKPTLYDILMVFALFGGVVFWIGLLALAVTHAVRAFTSGIGF